MPWEAGQSGNPAGRPEGIRQKLGAAFLRDLDEQWHAKGKSAISAAIEKDPLGFCNIVAKLLPNETRVTISDPLREAIELLAQRASGIGTLAGPTIEVRDGGDRGEPGALAIGSPDSSRDARADFDTIGPRCWEIDATGVVNLTPSCDALTMQGGHDSPDGTPVEGRVVGRDSDVAPQDARELAKSVLPD